MCREWPIEHGQPPAVSGLARRSRTLTVHKARDVAASAKRAVEHRISCTMLRWAGALVECYQSVQTDGRVLERLHVMCCKEQGS